MRLHHRSFVIHAEYHEPCLHLVVTTFRHKRIAAGFQFLHVQFHRLVGLHCPFPYLLSSCLLTPVSCLPNIIRYFPLNLLSCTVQITERNIRLTFSQYHLRNPHTEGRCTIAQRHRCLTMMTLARHIGDVHQHIEDVKPSSIPHLLFRQYLFDKRYRHLEFPCIVGHHLARQQFRLLTSASRPIPPPRSRTTNDPELRICTLNRHTCKTLHHSFHIEGVAPVIFLSDRVELHFECRSFVFLHRK